MMPRNRASWLLGHDFVNEHLRFLLGFLRNAQIVPIQFRNKPPRFSSGFVLRGSKEPMALDVRTEMIPMALVFRYRNCLYQPKRSLVLSRSLDGPGDH